MSISEKVIAYLARLLEPFRFIKHARERRAAERQEAHENMVDLIDTMLARVERIVEHSKEAAIAQSHSVTRIADGVGAYLDLLKQSAEAQTDLGSETVRPEDEYSAEQEREIERLRKLGFPAGKSRAEQLAWLVEHDEMPLFGDELQFDT